MSFKTPDVDQVAARPRKVTTKRGGSVEPEGYKPRVTGGKNDAYGAPGPAVESPKTKGPSGDHQTHTLPNEQIPMVMKGPEGDSRSMQNPLK